MISTIELDLEVTTDADTPYIELEATTTDTPYIELEATTDD